MVIGLQFQLGLLGCTFPGGGMLTARLAGGPEGHWQGPQWREAVASHTHTDTHTSLIYEAGSLFWNLSLGLELVLLYL